MKILLKNGKIVDVINSKIYRSDILIDKGFIEKIGNINIDEEKNTNTINATDYFLVPGLIDAHAHNEMTMLSPGNFAESVLSKGTTSIILDFHDLANVIGIKNAFEFNLNEFNQTLLNVFYMLPICVPSSKKTETCGNKDSLNQVISLLSKKEINGIAEVMDVPGVLNKESRLIKPIQEAKKRNLLIDGHCPELIGEKLSKYIQISGVSTDHEFVSIEEAQEKLNKGLKLILRRGITEEPNSYKIWNASKQKSNLMLSTDGCTTPTNIIQEGYMDFALREIIKEGIPAIDAIKMATINTSNHYKLKNIGAIKKGYVADILFISDLNNFRAEKVISKGKLFDKKTSFFTSVYSTQILNSIKKEPLSEEEFQVKINKKNINSKVRVIKLIQNSLITEEEIHELSLDNKANLKPNLSKDIIYVSIINRYNKKGKVINGFVKGFGLKSGAISCSNAQDAQNIITLGTNHSDMIAATNSLIKMQGGCVLVDNGRVINKISLPVAGIMSMKSAEQLKEEVNYFEKQLKELGCNMPNPLFHLSLMFTVSSIPKLKITDKGIYNVEENEFKSVIVK